MSKGYERSVERYVREAGALQLDRDETGGYRVTRLDLGLHLGRVFKPYRRGGWASQLPGEEATPADSRTRQLAAERLVCIIALRKEAAALNRPAPVPEGYEAVSANELQIGDRVIVPRKYTPEMEVKRWDTWARTVAGLSHDMRDPARVAVIAFAKDTANSQCWPYIVLPQCPTVARALPSGEACARVQGGGEAA